MCGMEMKNQGTGAREMLRRCVKKRKDIADCTLHCREGPPNRSVDENLETRQKSEEDQARIAAANTW